jgi:predicted ArsR family transcriptional regulator
VLARISTEFVLRRVNRVRLSVFGGDLITTLVFAAVTQANVGHVDDDDLLAARWGTLRAPPPNELRRPISGYAVALALGLPRETIRRKINALTEAGLLQVVESGFISPAETLSSDEMTRVTQEDINEARAFFDAMVRAGAVMAQDEAGALTRPLLPRMISRASNTYCLAVLEELRRLFSGEVMAGLIFCAIANANGRRPTMGGAPSVGWAPPSEERIARPITALALAETVGLPRETARRHIKKLEQLGFCEGGRRGLLIPESVLGRPAVQATFERAGAGARRFLQRLSRAGVLAEQDPASA